jgi:hypothetical protein
LVIAEVTDQAGIVGIEVKILQLGYEFLCWHQFPPSLSVFRNDRGSTMQGRL